MAKASTPLGIIKILKPNGFMLKRTKESHHIFHHPQTNRRTIVPLHRKDLPKGTLREILKQAGLSRDDLQSVAYRWRCEIYPKTRDFIQDSYVWVVFGAPHKVPKNP